MKKTKEVQESYVRDLLERIHSWQLLLKRQPKKRKEKKNNMKRTIYFDDFVDAFEEMGRIEQFSEEGLKALFDYLEEFEKDTGIELELDVIALSVDFTEYEDFDEFKWDYSAYVEEHNIQNLDDLADHTIVIKVDEKAFIIQDF